MEFSEALRLGGYFWDAFDREFSEDVSPRDWVLISRGYAPVYARVVLVFDENFLEIGESVTDVVTRWSEEAGDVFDVKLVEDVEEELQRISEDESRGGMSVEDVEAQFWEDERWRDDY